MCFLVKSILRSLVSSWNSGLMRSSLALVSSSQNLGEWECQQPIYPDLHQPCWLDVPTGSPQARDQGDQSSVSFHSTLVEHGFASGKSCAFWPNCGLRKQPWLCPAWQLCSSSPGLELWEGSSNEHARLQKSSAHTRRFVLSSQACSFEGYFIAPA